MMPLHKSLKSKLVPLLFVSCLNFVLAIVLVIAMAVQSFTGLSSSIPLSIGNCTNSYYLLKYNNFRTTLLIIFIPAGLSIFIELILCILIVQPLIKQIRPSRLRLKVSYILIALQGMASIIISGYFITFQIDFNFMSSCETTFDKNMLMILLSISVAIALIFFLQIIFFIRAYSCLLSQLNYEKLSDSVQNQSKINYLLTQFKDMTVKANNLSIQQQITNRTERNKQTMVRQNLEKNVYKNQRDDNSRYYPPDNSFYEQGNYKNRQLDQSRKQKMKKNQIEQKKRYPFKDDRGQKNQKNNNSLDESKKQHIKTNQSDENKVHDNPQDNIQGETSFRNLQNFKQKQESKDNHIDHNKSNSHPQNNVDHQKNNKNQLSWYRGQRLSNPANIEEKYQNYIKRLNSKNIKQNESSLISVIRNKYNH